jgi:hypothetical protein
LCDPHFTPEPEVQPDGQNNQKGRRNEKAKIESQPADAARRVKPSGATVWVHQIIPSDYFYSEICFSKRRRFKRKKYPAQGGKFDSKF